MTRFSWTIIYSNKLEKSSFLPTFDKRILCNYFLKRFIIMVNVRVPFMMAVIISNVLSYYFPLCRLMMW